MSISFRSGALVVCSMIYTLLSTGFVQAQAPPKLSDDDLRAIYLDYPLYSATDENTPPCPSGVGAGGANLVGSENAERIFNFFVSPPHDLKPYQAAGIMGNMAAESGLEPRLVEYGWLNSRGETSVPGSPTSLDDDVPPDRGAQGQPGYGLVQWTSPGRKKGLRDRAVGIKAGDLGLQLNYVMEELNTGYQSVLARLRATTNVADATHVIEDEYEVHAGPRQPDRVTSAEYFLRKYGSGTPPSSAPAVRPANTCGGGSGDVAGGMSLPVPRSWYDQEPDWFTKPHHSGRAASDIPVPEGTEVYSITNGTVIQAPNGSLGQDGGYGLGVTIDAGNGVILYYGHGTDGGSVPGAKEGDTVAAGQLIMHSGNTGSSTGPHLHAEIRINGTKHCPQNLFVGIANGSPPPISSLPTSGCAYGGGPNS